MVRDSSETSISINWAVRSSATTLTKPASSRICNAVKERGDEGGAGDRAVLGDCVQEVASLAHIALEQLRGLLGAAAVV